MKKLLSAFLVLSIICSVLIIIVTSGHEDKVSPARDFQINYPDLRYDYEVPPDDIISPYMVAIKTYYDGKHSNATGFIVSQDDDYNYILTNRHAIDDGGKINCQYQNFWIYDADIVYVSKTYDIAVLKTRICPYCSVADIDFSSFTKEELIMQEGNIHGQGITTTYGSIVFTDAYTEEDTAYVISDAYASFGSSGGPVTDVRRKVKGIVYAINTDKNLTFVIPLEAVETELTNIVPGLSS